MLVQVPGILSLLLDLFRFVFVESCQTGPGVLVGSEEFVELRMKSLGVAVLRTPICVPIEAFTFKSVPCNSVEPHNDEGEGV